MPKPSKKIGKGIINTLIDHLPLSLHLPGGYQYAGPGTKVKEKLERGVKPKNKLDEAAMHHDIAYLKSKDLKDRHAADKILQEAAWERVKAKDSSLGEKAAGYLVTNTMKLKRAIGGSLYNAHPVNLSQPEREKLVQAISTKKKSVKLQLLKSRTKDSVQNEITLPLTRSQIKNLKNKKTITLSSAQLSKVKSGGFLPALIAAAPAIASVLGTIYNAYTTKKGTEKGKGIYLNKKKGTGVYLNKKSKPVAGNGLYKQLFRKSRSK